jgi:hypothetical protein
LKEEIELFPKQSIGTSIISLDIVILSLIVKLPSIFDKMKDSSRDLSEGEDEDYFRAARRKRVEACMLMMTATTAACVHHRQLIQAVFGTIVM